MGVVQRIQEPLIEPVFNEGEHRWLRSSVPVGGTRAGLAPDPLPPAVDSHQTTFRDAVAAGQNVRGDLILHLRDKMDTLLK